MDNVENLKGTFLLPVIVNPFKDVLIIMKIGHGNDFEIVFGRVRKILPRNILIVMHMVPLTDMDEKSLILEKCKGCANANWIDLPEAMFSINERSQIPCIILVDAREAFCISRNRWNKGINRYHRQTF